VSNSVALHETLSSAVKSHIPCTHNAAEETMNGIHLKRGVITTVLHTCVHLCSCGSIRRKGNTWVSGPGVCIVSASV